MTKFSVISISKNGWTGDTIKELKFESDSELECYKKALELQTKNHNDTGSPWWTSYVVEGVDE